MFTNFFAKSLPQMSVGKRNINACLHQSGGQIKKELYKTMLNKVSHNNHDLKTRLPNGRYFARHENFLPKMSIA